MNIALIGAAPSSDKIAPFGDPNWEIWACSPSNFLAPRVDAWFELHNLDRKWIAGNDPYVKALTAHSRVYVSHPDPRLPQGIIYPKDEVYKFFGTEHGPLPFMDTYMQSQVSYMLAFAIMHKPTKIGLWGIDMAADDEYFTQRPGCHFFFDEAFKRGIEIVAPPQSDILEPLPAYAYKEFLPMYWRQKARKIELMSAVAECDRIIKEKEMEKLSKMGALADLRYTNQTWMR